MTQINNIGSVLRQARINADMTQTQVANQIGVSLWTYNRVENGRRTFDEAWLQHLPQNIRQPLVDLMTEHTEQQLTFLRGLSRPKLARGSLAA
jgi:DNA-binding XRE family transcriptional regulator